MKNEKEKYIKQLSKMLLSEEHDEFLKIVEEIGNEEDSYLRDRIKEAAQYITEIDGEIAIYSNYTREELEHNTEIEDAVEEEQIKIAKAMIRKGYPVEDIKEITKLPIIEIEMLR